MKLLFIFSAVFGIRKSTPFSTKYYFLLYIQRDIHLIWNNFNQLYLRIVELCICIFMSVLLVNHVCRLSATVNIFRFRSNLFSYLFFAPRSSSKVVYEDGQKYKKRNEITIKPGVLVVIQSNLYAMISLHHLPLYHVL